MMRSTNRPIAQWCGNWKGSWRRRNIPPCPSSAHAKKIKETPHPHFGVIREARHAHDGTAKSAGGPPYFFFFFLLGNNRWDAQHSRAKRGTGSDDGNTGSRQHETARLHNPGIVTGVSLKKCWPTNRCALSSHLPVDTHHREHAAISQISSGITARTKDHGAVNQDTTTGKICIEGTQSVHGKQWNERKPRRNSCR